MQMISVRKIDTRVVHGKPKRLFYFKRKKHISFSELFRAVVVIAVVVVVVFAVVVAVVQATKHNGARRCFNAKRRDRLGDSFCRWASFDSTLVNNKNESSIQNNFKKKRLFFFIMLR